VASEGAAPVAGMRAAVVTFPGSNCDYDCYKALQATVPGEPYFLWHRAGDLEGADVVFLPGGFSYGDYLRAGAIARVSPVMAEVREFAARGGLVVGICNGFQILCEAGLLPGALIRNRNLRFVSRQAHVRVESSTPPFTSAYQEGQVLRLPVAHGEGCYVAPREELERLEGEGRVLFRYCDAHGEIVPEANPNGSINAIAGIVNREGNVLGMMPHPERAVEPLLGSEDGSGLFRSISEALARV
jgi:phosphoribosylformylglycinamidine synthase subunit PurQ / glutaminase